MKLGFAVNNLGFSQLSYYLIRSANAMLASRCDHDIIAFFEQPRMPSLPMLFSSMQFAEAWTFNGAVVSTSLATARKFLKFPCVEKRYFYVWDLEWVRLQRTGFRELHEIYASPKHTLVARSQEHADLISSCWNVPVKHVIEDGNIVPGFVELHESHHAV